VSPENQAGAAAPVSAQGPLSPRPSPNGEPPFLFEPPTRRYRPPKQRLWLHAVLLLLTMFTTTLVGAHMQYNFKP